jgi:CheY-like chemotaxis protein
MPESDGYQLIRHIRQESRFRHLRVIALTAFAMRGDREAILAQGFDAYLMKPIDFQQLRNELEDTSGTSGSSADTGNQP